MDSVQVTSLLFRNAWLLFIVVTCANAVVWWHRAQPRIAAQPELETGYRKLIKGWLVFGNIPWAVMGLGILTGSCKGVFDYFNPRNGPFVIAFYVTVVALWVLCFVWLFFKRGAEQLIRYPGLLNFQFANPWVVKIFFLSCVAGGIMGLAIMCFGNFQPPALR